MENNREKHSITASYYPGCSLEGTARAYDLSSRAVCWELSIDLQELPKWSCCGSSPALKTDKLLSTALSAHNLNIAGAQPSDDLLIPCPFCFRRLLSAQQEMAEDPELKRSVEETVEGSPEKPVNIHSLLGFIHDRVGLDAVKEKVVRPLAGMRVVPYYGCYLVKPHKTTQYDHPEQPVSLDELLTALGADVVDWDFKTECCGAGLALSKTDTVERLCGRIVKEAKWKRADAIVVACQLCQANLEMRGEKKGNLPVLYFTQLIGLALGLSPESLGMKKHLISPMPMLKAKGFGEKRPKASRVEVGE